MIAKIFNEIVEEQFDVCRNLMVVKAGEYATDDRLFNFKQPTSMMHQNPAQVCLSYQMKHMASCVKIAEDLNRGVIPTKELIDEKVTDMINYCLLFKANVMEQAALLQAQRDAQNWKNPAERASQENQNVL